MPESWWVVINAFMVWVRTATVTRRGFRGSFYLSDLEKTIYPVVPVAMQLARLMLRLRIRPVHPRTRFWCERTAVGNVNQEVIDAMIWSGQLRVERGSIRRRPRASPNLQVEHCAY